MPDPHPVADDIDKAVEALKADKPLDVLKTIGGVECFGALATFASTEQSALEGALAVTRRYVEHAWPPRPLCLAVFGPPGSGKSFAVEQIHALLRDEQEKKKKSDQLKLPITTLNLTQLDSRAALAEALARIAGEKDHKDIPFVFFDEFDAALDGAELGWLSWFLAPMQDGAFVHRGAQVKLNRAVYVFAGGTTSTFTAFTHPPTARVPLFKAAKGPDFVSRLRLTLDVAGPNAEPRALRRAPILAHQLGQAGVSLAVDFARSLLGVARYRHGSRSIGAVLDVSDLAEAKASNGGALDFLHLPDSPAMLDLHVDRGPLDPARVGGHVTMSGGGSMSAQATACWQEVARRLFQLGGTIAYGGKDQIGLTSELTEIVKGLQAPVAHPSVGAPVPRLRLRPPEYTAIADGDLPAYVYREKAPGLTPVEEASLPKGAIGKWWRRVLCLFRMRLLVAESAVACVAVGGGISADPSKRRMAGVAEEVIVHLALGKSVYVLGGFGPSAARTIGGLLGLERPWTGTTRGIVPTFRKAKQELLARQARLFRPPPWSGLPVTSEEIVAFCRQHAVGGEGWPDNGLTVEENRELFESADPRRIAGLLERGLTAMAEAR